MIKPALCIAGLLIATPVWAEEPQIVVTGQGLADSPAVPVYDVQSIDRRQLLRTPSGRIEDALAAVAGFQQFRRSDSRSANPSAQGVTLRALGGNATSRALVLLDGVPMADPFFGYVSLNALAPDRLASARITRGGGSGAFGAGAVAGTIELTSASPEITGPFSASALTDQRGDKELSAILAPRLKTGFVLLAGRLDQGPGFWTTPEAERVSASVRARYSGWSAGLRAVAAVAPDVELQVRLLTSGDRRTLRFTGADTTTQAHDASLRLVGRGAWGFDALVYAQLRDFSNVVISSSTFRRTLDQFKTPSTGFGAKLELRPPVGAGHTVRIGGDWRQGQGTAYENAYSSVTGALTSRRSAGGRNGDTGLFIEDDWRIGALTLTGGVRADRWTVSGGLFTERNPAGAVISAVAAPDRAGWQATWRAGARVELAALALRAAAYSGFRQPTLNELYRPFAVFPVTTRANAALRNERLLGIEGGLDWTPSPGATFNLTMFSDRLANAIANVTIAANLRQRQNVEAVRARGIEASVRVARGAFSLNGSLALTDAKVVAPGTALDRMRPAQTPRVAASAMLQWAPSDGPVFDLSVRHLGEQFEDDLMKDRLPPATTLGFYAETALSSDLSAVVRVENLTGAKVVTRNQAGSHDLGAPRTIWFGLRWGKR